MVKKFVLASLIGFTGFSAFTLIPNSNVYGWALANSVPAPSANLRQVIGDIFVKYMDENPSNCCVLGSRIYMFPTGLNSSLTKIVPFVTPVQKKVTLQNRSVIYYRADTATGSGFGYYVKSENGTTCIGYSLFEEIGANFKQLASGEDMTIFELLQSKGFSTVNTLTGPPLIPSDVLSLRFFEKKSGGYVERVVIGEFTGARYAVLAEMFYPQNMDGDFCTLLIQWLNTKLSFYNNL